MSLSSILLLIRDYRKFEKKIVPTILQRLNFVFRVGNKGSCVEDCFVYLSISFVLSNHVVD